MPELSRVSLMPMAQLGITHEEAGGWCVVTVSGEVDLATAPLLEAVLIDLADTRGHGRFVIDLSGVDHFDSSGLRVLVRLVGRLGVGAVKVAAAGPNLQAVLKLSGLEQAVQASPSVAEAIA